MSHCGPTITKYNIYCNGEAPVQTDWTFDNLNVTGQGVYDSTNGTIVGFRGIASSGGTISVTLDTDNKTVNVDINDDVIAGQVPDATTTVKGKVELATDAETIVKTDTARAITPSNLAALVASTTFVGMTRLATTAEALAGTSSTIAVTPAGLQAVRDAIPSPTTFTDSTDRGNTAPAIIGQIGVQQDTKTPYISTGTDAGDWIANIFTFGVTNTVTEETTVSLSGASIYLEDAAGASAGEGSYLRVRSSGGIDFRTDGYLMLEGSAIPANSIVRSSGTAGVLSSIPVADFFSNDSPTEAYTITNQSTSRTFDADTVTTSQLADVVATLIADISALTRPTV